MSIARHWGTTPAERALPFPCDALIERPRDELWRGVSADAPPTVVFRWLCQLRAAPYSYDWIDNRGRRSPQQLTPGLEDLEVGQRVMTIFTLASFERDVQMTLRVRGGTASRLFGEAAVTYLVRPDGEGSRLLAKLVTRYPRNPLGWAMRLLLPWGDLVMMRRQLLNLKRLAEQAAADRVAP